MQRKDIIRRAINKRWHDDDAGEICLKILDFVSSRSEQNEVMLNYADLHRITGRGFDNAVLQRALAILISRFDALSLGLVFFDDYGKAFYLDGEQKLAFIESGYLAHPETGQNIEDAENRTYPYYLAYPPELLKEVPA